MRPRTSPEQVGTSPRIGKSSSDATREREKAQGDDCYVRQDRCGWLGFQGFCQLVVTFRVAELGRLDKESKKSRRVSGLRGRGIMGGAIRRGLLVVWGVGVLLCEPGFGQRRPVRPKHPVESHPRPTEAPRPR